MGSTSMEQCARSWIHKFVLVKKMVHKLVQVVFTQPYFTLFVKYT